MHFVERETVKAMSEGYTCMNTFWLLLGGGPFFGWWCLVVDIFWVVVDIFWLVVGGSGWWGGRGVWVVA